MSEIRLRPAQPHEADAVTELSRRSKAHWGYSQEFLDRVRDILVVHPHQIRDDLVVVAERDSELLGFYRLDGKPPEGELADLFLEPAAIGTGLGRRLWEHALASAKAKGFESLDLEADPNAEPFYRHMGAVRTGEHEVSPGRSLPIMTVSL
ncbi:GNAT family N-acetyltransferase [Amycolatopsis sp. cg5]|uniref:GNAT family N-acetyltransferase n=1 Tax=Amycolatopsis sp. cg5 TaxID=3238802 RepID=UPI003523BDA9